MSKYEKKEDIIATLYSALGILRGNEYNETADELQEAIDYIEENL